MIKSAVANLQQAGIVLYRDKNTACENKIMLLFVILSMPGLPLKNPLLHICVAINAPVNAKSSWLLQICDFRLSKIELPAFAEKTFFK